MKKFKPKYLVNKNEEITGYLTALTWNEEGQVQDFSILTEDNDEILLFGFKNRKKLNDLLNKRVTVGGVIIYHEENEKSLKADYIKYSPSNIQINSKNTIDVYEEFLPNILNELNDEFMNQDLAS